MCGGLWAQKPKLFSHSTKPSHDFKQLATKASCNNNNNKIWKQWREDLLLQILLKAKELSNAFMLLRGAYGPKKDFRSSIGERAFKGLLETADNLQVFIDRCVCYVLFYAKKRFNGFNGPLAVFIG